MSVPEYQSTGQGISEIHLNERAVATILKGYEEFRIDIFGKIISSNLEAVNVTGYEEWEVIGKHISMFYTPEAIQAGQVEQDLAKARAERKYAVTAMMMKKRQVAFWAKLSVRCIYDESGAVTGFFVVLKDRTHRLINNNKLKRFKNEYRNLFDNAFIGIFKFRKDNFKILLLNNKAELIIGDATVSKFYEIFRHRDEFDTLMSRVASEIKIVAFEFQLAFDKSRWARIDCQWFEDDGFVEGVISDVTESKTQLHELERLNAELDNFIYRASHDLRSPLTTLMGLINLLDADAETPPRVYHDMMRDRVTHLDHLLADLAAITHNRKAKVNIEPISFALIKQAVMSAYCSKANINFSTQSEGIVYTDADRLLTIFRKIIEYSIRYSNSSNEFHRLSINVAVNDQVAEIKISDNGRGLPADQLSKVFDLFHKPTNDIIDTGIGLYMTKLLVEKLSGTITIQSQVGEGTTIHIVLPTLNKTLG